MSLLFIVLNDFKGFKAIFSVWSMLGGSRMSRQKWKLFRARRTSLDADLARCLVTVGDSAGGVESRATEWGRESNLGVEIGEGVGGVGERVQSVRWAGVFLDCCEGGMIWAGRWSGTGDFILFFFSSGCCWGGVWILACANFFVCFLSPCSTCESPLSLLRFKLTEVSIFFFHNFFFLAVSSGWWWWFSFFAVSSGWWWWFFLVSIVWFCWCWRWWWRLFFSSSSSSSICVLCWCFGYFFDGFCRSGICRWDFSCFFGRPFLFYLGPPLFILVGVVPSFFFWRWGACHCGSRFRCWWCRRWRSYCYGGLLRAGPREVPQFLAKPTLGLSAPNNHHHSLVFVIKSLRDGLKPLSIQWHSYYVVSVCGTTRRFRRCDVFYVPVLAEVPSEHIPIQLDGDIAHGDSYFSVTLVFRLEPVIFRWYITPGQFLCKVFRRQQDIPGSEAPSTKIPRWDPCCLQQLLESLFLYSGQSPSLKVRDNERYYFRLDHLNQLWYGQNTVPYEELGVFCPLLWIVFRGLFLYQPGDWRFWHFLRWWYRTGREWGYWRWRRQWRRQRRPFLFIRLA